MVGYVSWLILIVVAVVAAVIAYLLGRRSGVRAQETVSEQHEGDSVDTGISERDFLNLVGQLPGSVVLLNSNGVLKASQSAQESGVLRRGQVLPEELVSIGRMCVADQVMSTSDITIRRIPHRKADWDLRVTALPVGAESALLLLDDLTAEHRLHAVRRDFVANVSHELKTPVGAMALLAEAIVAAKDEPDTVAQFASSLQSETRRLTRLINDVIDLSRLQGEDPLLDPQEVPVETLTAGAIAAVQSHARAKGIRIVTSVAHTWVRGDPEQLEIAISNLLTNAIAYSDDATTVAIVARLTEDAVEIDVKDQGIGIPENELDRVFERFYRVDEARSRVTGGTGLGLAIVRNVCENHGGEATAWSVLGEGSTFRIRLPRLTGPPPEQDEHDQADPAGENRIWTRPTADTDELQETA